ncbi:MAG: amino acid adenylation domain-containing protein [Alphaproteobacteria bacterium]|nr:amino acid adenylation domain-containing protein [Alphaproteobacteria bacterium]MBV9372338.1 amino acid adenylation domain-containing protein [Alphaproteobacteria bacterium]MBV9899630.1 amino acid adenylation domain-containing protein [Alphaproteobacteria bacterium]
MRTIDVVLSELRRLGVKLSVEQGELRCRAPSGTLSADQLSEIRAMRGAIIEALESAGPSPRDDAPPAGEPRPAVIPLSFAQSRLWLLDRMGLGGSAYNIGVVVRLDGALDRPALQGALDALVARHEALRTRLPEVEGEGTQAIDPPSPVPLPLVDVSDAPDPDAESSSLADRETARSFDLAAGPLFRALLLRVSPARHRLVLTMHHAVSDGWSVMRILFPELIALYAEKAGGGRTDLPPLRLHYADHALRQRRRLKGEVLDRQLSYWRGALAGAPAFLDLPTDRARPARQSFRGARVAVAVPDEVAEGLRRLAAAEGATLFTVVLSAYALLLARWSGQDDVVVGTPSAGRRSLDTERLFGFFVNTLPLRVRLQGPGTFRDLVGQVKATTIGAWANQDVPFDVLVESLDIPRDPSRQALIQALLALHNEAGQESATAAGMQWSLEESDNGGAQMDVALHVYETPDGLRGWLEYAADLFDGETAARMAGHFARLLAQAADDWDRPLAGFEPMGDEERRRTLVDWNGAQRPAVDAGCVHARFEDVAARLADAVALSFEGEETTYGALDEKANKLAHHLVALGVGPDEVVGICLDRGPDMVVSILAILKAGGAYLPLDPDYPPERLDFMLRDAGASALIVDASTAAIPLHADAARVAIDGDWPEIARRDPGAPPSTAGPSNLAYVIYTSGSAGRPKGVMVEHGAVSDRLLWMQARYPLGRDDVVLLKTPFSFDVSVCEFLWTLGTGARLEIARPRGHLDPDYLARTIEARGVTVIQFVPSMLAAFVSGGALARCGSLRLVLAAGEALPHALAQAFLEASGAELHNLYGPTEAAIYATFHHVTPASGSPVPIGRPLWNTQVYVLDERRRPVPQGVRGELYLAGTGLARGYCGLPELTEERFVDNPFAGPGARMYRTGDIVRWRQDGELEYLGRTDDQVKLRGFRIELGEIEARLSTFPGIREAAVVAREDTPGDKRLVAYFTAGEDVEAAALRAHLAAALPDHMVPAAYVRVETFALTPNGKLDRKALRAPDETSLALDPYEAPAGEIETRLAAIWREVLGVARVGRHDNFFALGGHSLLALRVLERIRSIGLEADVREIFEAPSLSAFAATMQADAAASAVPPNPITPGHDAITPDLLPLIELSQEEIDRIVATVPGGAANVQDIYPLTPLQEGILFHHLVEEVGDTYLALSLLSLPDRESAYRHAAALDAAIRRHDALRTAVVWEGLREPVQVVWREAPLRVEELRLSPGDGEISEQLTGRFSPRRYRIDLRQAPMMRAFLAEDAANDRWLMLFLAHHLVDDATSLRLLMDELRAHLDGVRDLPEPVPFRNFVARSRAGADEEEQAAFFREMLGGIEEPTAPFGLLDIRASEAEVVASACALEPDLAARIREASRKLRVSAASLFHAACGLVIGRLSDRDEALFGTVLLGRMQGGGGADGAIGAFINTLPLTVRLGSTTVEACVRDTHRRLAGVMRYEHTPLTVAQRCSDIAPPAPLFTAIVNYRHDPEPVVGDGQDGAAGPRQIRSEERTNYPLALIVDDSGDGFSVTVQARSPIDPARMLSMTRRALEGVVAALASSPETPMAAIDCLPAEDRALMGVGESGRPAGGEPDPRPVHALFEDWAERRPDAAALTFGQEWLSYGELNARSNRLARFLRSAGVRPGSRVAICAGRSPHAIVAVLAVLKAGAAYVPMDPAYPAERLAFMLDDSAPALVLTDAGTAPALSEALARARPCALELVHLDADAPKWAGLDPANPEVPDDGAGRLAYIIYTSGSTGRPKGVMIEHRNLGRLFTATRPLFHFGEADVWTLFHSLAFDFSVWEMWGPLAHGGRLVLVSHDCARSPEQFHALLCAEGVTVLNQTPGAFLNLMTAEAQSAKEHALRLVIFGGEMLRPHLLAPWVERNPLEETRLVNMYGITETTVHATHHTLSMDDVKDSDRSRIGVPLPDLDIHILDRNRQLSPFGVAGEMYIGGAGVAQGYLNRPELTAERFLPSPFVAGERLYKSGDLARRGADGVIEYLGRTDDQVKLRGFRIELGEIEARLSSHPGVREAVVLAREDVPGAKRLVAYFTAADGVEAASLRAHLAAALPDYMVPAAYVRLDGFALTPNGKLDRKALRAPDEAAFALHAYEPPVGETETALAAIWREVLGVERVGRDDNFFALGGDSMLAVQLTLRARLLIPAFAVADVFRHPTIREVGAAVAGRAAGGGVATLPPAVSSLGEEGVDNDLYEDAYPLTTMQSVMLREYDSNRGSERGAYHAQQWIRVRHKGCSAAAMEQAARMLVEAQPVLRTRFLETAGGQPVQAIRRAAHERVAFDVHEVAGLPPDERERYIAAAIVEDRTRPLPPPDGASGALRFVWFECGDDVFVLLISIHHAIDDGWGNQYFLSALFDSYERMMRGEAPALPLRDNVFKEYVALEREIRGSKPAVEFWRSRELPVTNASTLPASAQEDARATGSVAALRPGLVERLYRTAREMRVSVKALALSAYIELLETMLRQGSPTTVGIVANGRSDRLSDPISALGLFWNLVPVCVPFGGTQAKDHAAAVLKALVALEPFAIYPLPRIAADRGATELFFATFNFLNFHEAFRGEGTGAMALVAYDAYDRLHYPLNLAVSLDRPRDEVTATLHFDLKHFQPSLAETLMARYLALLEQRLVA